MTIVDIGSETGDMDSLSHDLVGKIVRPREGFRATWKNNFSNKEVIDGTVVAVWKRSDDRLMLAVKVSNGEMGEFFLTDLAIGAGD